MCSSDLPAVLSGLAVAFMLSTLPGLIAAAAYTRLGLTRASFDATRAGLDSQRADSTAR